MNPFKLNTNTYIHLFTDIPSLDFTLYNWNYNVHYVLGIPYIIYTKIIKP